MADIDYAKKLADLETSNRKTVEGLTADLVSSSKIPDEALRAKARNEITEKIKSNLAFYNSEKQRLENLYRTSLSNRTEQNRIQVRQNEARLEQERIASKQAASNSQPSNETPPQTSEEETANQEAAAQSQLGEGLSSESHPDYEGIHSAPPVDENPEAKPLVKPISGESLNIGTRSKNNLGIHADELLSDSQWVRNAFMMPSAQLDKEVKLNRFFSLADFKYVDTKPGGSIGCNMRPGFTPYADIRRPGRFPDRAPFTVNAIDNGLGFGAGRQWSDHFDDPAQKIWVQFGVPQFNTVTNFLRKAFTYEEMVMVRRGTAPSFLYDVAKMAGGYVLFKAFPVPVMGFLFIKGLNWLFSRPSNKYYSLKPTMHQYWSAVNALVNIWAINRGLMPKALKINGTDKAIGRPLTPSSGYMDVYSALFPDFFVTVKVKDVVVSSYIDAFAFANKAQRMANIMFIREYQRIDNLSTKNADDSSGDDAFFGGYLGDKLKGMSSNAELNTFMQRGGSESGGNYHSVYSMMAAMVSNNYWFKTKLNINDPEYDPRLKNKSNSLNTTSTVAVAADVNGNGVAQQSADGTGMDAAEKSVDSAINAADKANAPDINPEQRTAAQESTKAALESAVKADLNQADSKGTSEGWLDNIIDLVNGKDDYADKVFESLSAQYAQGAAFACFCVDYTGSTSESFNSSYGEAKISQDLNSMSSKAKEFRFAIGDGNIAGDTIKAFVETVSDTVMGLTESVTLGISNLMLGLAGSGYIDVPKHWNNSNASIVKMNYSMSLISPYNNVMSQLQNIYIPLFMLLAGIAPRSTGKSSYGAPFICQLFDRGRTQSQLCALESLTVNRGSSNLGFSVDGKALAIDVSFSFISLSEIMHMPITNGGLTEAFQGFGIDDDNMISDYLAVLAGQDMHTQIYAAPRMFMRLAKLSASIGKLGSPHWLASFSHDKSINGGGLFLLTRPLFKLYEAANVGKSITNNALTGSN